MIYRHRHPLRPLTKTASKGLQHMLLTLGVGALMAGCGQKGALTLPQPETPTTHTLTASPVTVDPKQEE